MKDERMEWNVSQLIEAQHIDKFCSKVEFWIRDKGNVEFPSEIKIPCEEFFIENGVLYREVKGRRLRPDNQVIAGLQGVLLREPYT